MKPEQNVNCSRVEPSGPESLVDLQVAALEATANAVVITDQTGTVIWVNSAFERLTGYTCTEMVGKSTRVLKSGQNPPVLYQEMWRTILAGRIWHGELVNRCKDGSLYDEEMTITPVLNSAGTVSHFVAIKQDITKRKRTEDRLALLSQSLESTSEYIGIGDTNANITFANQAWLRALGYSEQELVGQSFRFIISSNNPAKLVEEIEAKTLAGGWRGECLQRRKDGTDVPVLLSTGVLKDCEGRVSAVFGIARDITERKYAEQETLFKNALLEAQAETAIDGILVVDEADHIVLANKQFGLNFGIPDELLITRDDLIVRKHVADKVEDPDSFVERVEYLNNNRDQRSMDELKFKNGQIFDRYSAPLIDSKGRYRGRIWYFREITQRVKAEAQLRLWSRVLDQSAEGIFVCDPQERILLVNVAFEKLTGYSAAEALGKTPRILQSGQHDRAFYVEMWKSVSETGAWSGEMLNRRKSGELYVEWLSISAVYDHKGVVTQYVGIFSDITIRKKSEERMIHLAHYDALTDLPNRVLLMDRLDQLTKATQRRNSKVAVVFIDLDRFKEVNDSLGHDSGDTLLRTIAKRLSDAVRDEDTVARMGGDEFVVVFQGLHEGRDAAMLAQKLLSCVTEPVALNGYEHTVTASLGISLFPDDATNGQEMIRNADAAMYQAKNKGRNTYQFYTSDLNQHALEMLSMENSLRRAIERHEFQLHYQPQVDISSGSLVGAEALIRWNHPDSGLVMPGKFIPIAEERGLIVPIGNWVIEEAARQAAAWQNAGISFPVAVNVSALQFRQKDFVEQLVNIVRKHGISPNRLELELTESIIMRDAETTVETLKTLHEFGFQLTVDDFGTGYSSLSYIRKFPIDKIKIDHSFLWDATHDESAGRIVTAIIGLARSLQLKVIAEGVETSEQLEILRQQGCDQAQGFLFSPALGSEAFEKLICTWMSSYPGASTVESR